MLACILLLPAVAAAEVEGTNPTKIDNWRLFGAHSASGAALMVGGSSQTEINSILLSSATAQILDLPYDAEVAAAYLFWSGSSPRTDRAGLPDPPDRDADFTTSDGTFYNDLSVDSDLTGFGRCVTTDALGGFYYCRRDITDIIRAMGPGNANGIYTVGDVDADAGSLIGGDPQRIYAQAKYAGWSMILVWNSSTQTVRRDVVLYDGFLRLDETLSATGVHAFSLGDFLVGSPALGKLTVFGLEGDRQLGVPSQDAQGCPNCWDFISFQSASASSPTVLWNGVNDPYNSFNSSTDTSIDIDTYYLDGMIETGDTSTQVTVGSGDGVLDSFYNGGNGESFFVGWVIMTIDTLTPNFGGAQTRKTVVPTAAGPGQNLFYLIDVVNEGSLAATGVSVQDSIPTGTTYVQNSTHIDGVPVADVGGTSALVAGLNLGTIPTSQDGDNTRQITFQVRVDAAACGGSIGNTATVDSSQTEPVEVGPVTTTVSSTALEPPTKSVSFVSPPPVGPGDAFSYTIDLVNNGGQDAVGVSVNDPLPEDMVVSTVFSTSGSWSITAGTLTVTDLTVPAGGSAQVVVLGRVRTVAEFSAAGIVEDSIDGRWVANQATVSGGCTPDQLTDDPDVGGFQATEFQLIYAPVLDTSSKQVLDVNGDRLEPGDVVRYSITVVNTGNRAAEVMVTDAMPAETTYVLGSTQVDGVPVADVGGQSALVAPGLSLGQLSYIGDIDRVITFEVTVDALAPNGTVVQNSADLHVPVAPSADLTVTSPALTVYAAPAWDDSTKTVADTQPPVGIYEPGEEILYTLTVDNSGNRPATGVVVTDTLPTGLVFISASNGGSFSGGIITWNLADIPRDTSVVLTVQASIVAPLNNGTVISNTATVRSNELPDFVTPPATFSVTSSPRLRVTKVDEHPSTPVRPGDPVTYRLRIWNEGTASAVGVAVIDTLDPSLTGATSPTGQLSGGAMTWDPVGDPRLADIPPGLGNAVELEFTANVVLPLPNGTLISNQALVAPLGFPATFSDDPDDPTSDVDPTVFTILSQATLTHTKTVEDLSPESPYLPGDRVLYTLTLVAGGDAPTRDLLVSDPVDPSLEAVDASSSGGSVGGGVVTWSTATGAAQLGRLDPGGSVSLTFEATVRASTPNGTQVSNQATAASSDIGLPLLSDGSPGVAGAQPTVFTVVSVPVLQLSKAVELWNDDDSDYNPGDELRYTLTLTNIGTATTSDAAILDVFDGNLTLVDADGGTQSGSTVTWNFAGPLLPQASVTVQPRLRITFPLDDGSVISNQAETSSVDIPGPVLSDDPALPGIDDPTVVIVRSAPVFDQSTKAVRDLTGDPLVTRPGDRLEYTVVVRNDGDSDADDVVVRDPVPAELIPDVPGNGRLEGSDLVWDAASEPALGRLAAGDTLTFIFTATVRSPLQNGTVIANQATLESEELTVLTPTDDPATTAVDDPTRVTVVSASDLGGTTKVVTDSSGAAITTARPGETVRYSITVTNRGDAPARNVVVDDVHDPVLTVTAAAPGADIQAAANRVRWTGSTTPALRAIAPNQTVTLWFDVQLDTPLDNGRLISNQGELTADGLSDPVLTDADAATLAKEETVFTVLSSAVLATPTKVFVDPATGAVLSTARPGDAVRVLITLRNDGDANALDVRVNDTLDTTLLTSIIVRDGGSLAGGVATWNLPQLPPGTAGQATLRIDARLRTPLDPATLLNQAFVGLGAPPTVPTDDPGQPGPQDPTRLTINSAPDLTSSTKDVIAATGRQVAPGETFIYTFELRNTGDGNARNVIVTDILAPELEFVTATGGGTWSAAARTLTWQFAALPGGSDATFTAAVRVAPLTPNGTVIDNQARISADGMPPELTDDPQASVPDTPTRVTVNAQPNLSTFDKTVRDLDSLVPGMVRPGDRLRYSFRLRNDGNAVARDVEVRDAVDVSQLSNLQPVSPFHLEGNEVVFDSSGVAGLSSMEPGDEVVLEFDATINAGVADGSVIRNQAVANSIDLTAPATSDDPSEPGSADATEIQVRYPQLTVTKSMVDDNGGDPEAGDRLTFGLTVANVGSFPAQDVRVSDTLAAEFVEVVAAGATVSGRTYTWSLGTLAPNTSSVVSFSARIQPGVPNGLQLSNQATARSTGTADVASNVIELRVVAIPDLSNVTKTVRLPSLPGPVPGLEVAPGDTVNYEITIPNEGSGAATRVRVTDAIDPWLTVVLPVPNGGQLNGETITWNLGRVDAGGAPRVVSFSATVADDAPHREPVFNQAVVEAADGLREVSDDPTTPVADDRTRFTVIAAPVFGVTELRITDLAGSVIDGPLNAGQRVRYHLRVVNDGNTDSRDTTARLGVPAFTHYLRGTTSLNGDVVADRTDSGSIDAPLARGMLVNAASTDVEGEIPVGDEALVTFDVQVDELAMPGTRVAAQAVITSAEGDPGTSDDPDTSIVGDPTTRVVGGGPRLVVSKTASLQVDQPVNGRVDPGDTLRYSVRIVNVGNDAAEEVSLIDPLSEGATFVPGTLSVDGLPQGDPVPPVEADLGVIAAAGERLVTFDVVVGPVTLLSNQAVIVAQGLSWSSDGDPGTPGEQPTLTQVDQQTDVLGVALDVADVNGGSVEPGDRLRYSLTVLNEGARSAFDVALHVPRPNLTASVTIVDDGRATLVNSDSPTWVLEELLAGERSRVEFEVVVDAEAEEGQVIETHGAAETPLAAYQTDPVGVVVGGGLGSGAVDGIVFRDRGPRNGSYDDDVDEPLVGFSALLVPEARLPQDKAGLELQNLAIRSVATRRDGRYSMNGVPTGRYVMWVVSGEGVLYAETPVFAVAAGLAANQDVAVDPSGIIYQELGGVAVPVAGARVFLIDTSTGMRLPNADLFGGQQGQTTTGQGYYRFDVRGSALPGSFVIEVEPASATLFFPSAIRPPEGATDANPLGDPAEVGADGRVVDSDIPNLAAETRYFLRFDLDLSTPNITNNHIPVDRLAQHIRITKRVNRRTATVGDVLTYTVEIENPLDRSFLADDAIGGVVLVDDLPVGIRWPGGTASRVETRAGRVLPAEPLRTSSVERRTVRFVPMDLPARSRVTVRYYGVVGIGARGDQVNRARIIDRGGAVLSNEGSATVRIIEDPIFDQGTILGRVFCDDVGDGELGPEDPGLPGARVYLDSGFYVDTDVEGKFHFRGVAPGRHLVKLDMNTVPAGSEPTSDIVRQLHITRGLLGKVSFGVRCGWESVKPTHVTLKEAPPPPPKPTAIVSIDPGLPGLSLDGDAQALPLVDAELTIEGAEPNFDAGLGLNLAGPSKLTWNIRSASRVRFERWEVGIFTVAGEAVWRVAGDGRPPVRVPWELTAEDTPLQPGVEYLYRIAARTTEGDLGEGSWRRLGVRLGAPKAAPSGEPLSLWRGKLFRGDTDKPMRDLKRRATELAKALLARKPVPKILIEVHVADSPRRTANLLLSQRQAVAIKGLLTEAGMSADIIAAAGKGDTRPLMPNVSRRARERNRRIVVLEDAPTFATGPLPPIAYPALIVVGDVLLPTPSEQGGRIEREVEVDVGARVRVDLRQANGRRVRIERVYPFGVDAGGDKRSVEIAVQGSIDPPELRFGESTVPMSLLAAECGLQGLPSLTADGLQPPARFSVRSAAPLRSWLIRILNPEGTVLRDLSGDEQPPETVEWGGKNAAGAVVVRKGAYAFRCLLTDAEGNRAVTSPQLLPIEVGGGDKPSYARTLNRGLYPESGTFDGPLMPEFERVVAALKASPGSRLRLEVHDAAEGGKLQAQIRTARLATQLKATFIDAGIPEGAIDAAAVGATRPVMPGASRRARTANRRVVLEVYPPQTAPRLGEPAAAHVRVAGVELKPEAAQHFTGTIVVEADATLVVDVAAGDGRSAIINVPLFEGRPLESSQAAVPRASRPAADATPLGNLPRSLMEAPPSAPVAEPSEAEEPSFHASLEGGTVVDAIVGWSRHMPPAALRSASGEPELHVASARPQLYDPSSTLAGHPEAQEASTSVTVPVAEAPETLATDLFAYLPPTGAALPGERMTVRGRSDRGNVVRVNGKVMELDEFDRFVHTMVLPPGETKVEVTAEAPDGNIARIERSYTVPDSEWFLLAMADGIAGWGGKLDGMNEDTTLDYDNDLYLHGRGVAYFKGRVKGSALLGGGPFEDLRLTAHADSGKPRDSDLVKQLIDPDRYYAAYGDSAEEVQDVSTRHKVYLLLEADRSKLRVGNFKASLDGLELFRYHRTYFGASLDVDHEIFDDNPTEVHAFVAAGEAGVRHRQVTYQGTGGSMYFLRDGDLLEGSERVELVVRDRDTGMRLLAVPQVRNSDYTIDYRDGRMVFSQPIASVVMAGWRLNQNPLSTLDGHPVFVEMEYDYDSPVVDDGDTAFAVQARQTLFDRLTLGGGYVDEDKTASGGSHYRLIGGEARLRLGRTTRLDVEVAYSEAEDADHLVSVDGGLTFGALGMPVDPGSESTRGAPLSEGHGWAAKARLAGDIGELTGHLGDTPVPAAQPKEGEAAKKGPRGFLPYALHFQHQDRGFYSGTSILEQGQTKAGGQLRWLITGADTVRLRHDGIWSRLFVGDDERSVNRQLSLAGYERQGDGWKAGLEYGHTFWDDGERAIQTDAVKGFGELRLTPRLVGTLEQEGIIRGDDRVIGDMGDRFVSSLSLRYQLAERLWLTATESLRWSGSNSTQLGLKTKLSDDISLYASERLTAGDGRRVSTTVVGGESTSIPGSRSYAEYQLDALSSGRSGRAVIGMDNRWTVATGLKLHLSYERSQLVGDAVGRPLGGATGYAVGDPQVVGNGSGALARDQQFTASGYSSAGVFPAGVASRDAFATGLEYLRSKTMKAGIRFEMRYDRGDELLGAPDRLVLSGQGAANWRWDRNLVLLARARGATVFNLDLRDEVSQTLGFAEAQFLDLSLGLAFRPVRSDRFEGLMKWTRRYDRRPVNGNLRQQQLEIADVISVEPVVEIGGGVQFVGKAAIKFYEIRDAELPRIRSSMLLGIGRVNYHLSDMFDAGVEYRWLGNFLTEEMQHGALVEFAWIPVRYVAVGLGYNFTHFSDDLLADPLLDQHGVFLRATGRY